MATSNKLFDKSKLVELGILIIRQEHKIEAFILNAIDQKKRTVNRFFLKKYPYILLQIESFSFDSVAKEITISKSELSKALQEIEIYLKSFTKTGLS